MKNNAILSAGNTKPTSGTKIAGKKDADIYLLLFKFWFQHKNHANICYY